MLRRKAAAWVGSGESRTHVAVAAEVLQQLDLAKGSLGQNLLAKNIGDLLDGDALVGLVVHGGTIDMAHQCQLRIHIVGGRRSAATKKLARQDIPHDSVCALSQLLGDGVSFVDDKVLVENLKDLASL